MSFYKDICFLFSLLSICGRTCTCNGPGVLTPPRIPHDRKNMQYLLLYHEPDYRGTGSAFSARAASTASG